jgi:hypothetical protein
MIHDFDDLCTCVYVIVDDIWQTIRRQIPRSGPESEFSDSEVMTLAIVAEIVEMDEEKAFLKYIERNHQHLFPKLPDRTRYNRRRRQLTGALNEIRRRLLPCLPVEHAAYCLIDSLPVPVVAFHRAPQTNQWLGWATFGKVASKKQTIFGFKLHFMTTEQGIIVDFVLAAANHHDVTLAEQMLMPYSNLVVIGDKGYIDELTHSLLLRRNKLVVLTPKRRNQKTQLSRAASRCLNKARQMIETVGSQLSGQFNIEINKARCMSGLLARICAKLAAHTVGIYLNRLLGRPYLNLKDLALI